jgi:hypothetical protein
VRQRPDHNIAPEPERFLALGRRIAVHFGVSPPVTWVALIGIVDYEPPIAKYAETLRGFSVVLVGLGGSSGEGKWSVIDPIGLGEFNKRII